MYVYIPHSKSVPNSFIYQRLVQWLKNWRGRARRGEVTRWNPPAIGVPKKRKPRSPRAFDVFCQSDDAPKGSDFLQADGRRCDLSALNAARAAAWHALSAEEQDVYVTATQETFEGESALSATQEPVDDSRQGAVAYCPYHIADTMLTIGACIPQNR